jgi:hypothetical protein
MLLFFEGRLTKIDFYDYGDTYMASASTSDCSVWNCYGTTKKAAKEMAL